MVELAALVTAFVVQAPRAILLLLVAVVVAKVGVALTTIKAAPIMQRIGKTEDKAEILSPLIERFVNLNYLRAAFIWVEYGLLLWVLLRIATMRS